MGKNTNYKKKGNTKKYKQLLKNTRKTLTHTTNGLNGKVYDTTNGLNGKIYE